MMVLFDVTTKIEKRLQSPIETERMIVSEVLAGLDVSQKVYNTPIFPLGDCGYLRSA